jgi:hypothetical protein
MAAASAARATNLGMFVSLPQRAAQHLATTFRFAFVYSPLRNPRKHNSREARGKRA